jgi:hypothetical protein
MLPFHVARFSEGEVATAEIRCDAAAELVRAWSGVCGFIGEGGAYISESCARDEGEVSPTRTCLTLSDWVCVLKSAECKAARRGEVGGEEGTLIKLIGLGANDQTAVTYMLSSSSRRLIAS